MNIESLGDTMRLKNITFHNFRCFKELNIDLHPRLTVLVAENGGGKTSVLDGIAIGLSALLPYLSSANQRLSGVGFKDTDFLVEDIRKNDIPQKSDYTRIELLAADDYTGRNIQWDRSKSSIKGGQPPKRVGQKSLSELGKSILESYKEQAPKLLPVFSYYGAGRGWLPIPQRLRGTKIDYQQPTSALIGALESSNNFKEMLNWFDLEESAELRANKGCRPEDYESSELLEPVREVVESILGGHYKNPQFNRQHKFVVDTGCKPRQLQVSQLSQGYQAMLALGMDFARRMALANRHLTINDVDIFIEKYISFLKHENIEHEVFSPPLLAPSIMLVDEIDLHLHPSWQQRVLTDLMRAFPATQFIVTTHSPQVLTSLRAENIRILNANDIDGWQALVPDMSPLAHESGDALAFLMDTHPKPVIEGVTDLLKRYEQLAKDGLIESEETKSIEKELLSKGYRFNEADNALFAFLARKKDGGNI